MVQDAGKQKQAIRENLARKRRYLTKQEKQNRDAGLYKTVTNLPEWKKAQTVFIYVSTRYEASTKQLIKDFIKKKSIIVPKTHLKYQTLTLHHIQSLQETTQGNYAIYEPHPSVPMIAPSAIDLALVPGIAFDKNGHRIGYGKGYYDGLMTQLKCPKFALAYELQIVDNIPAQKHDIPVDGILTENTVYRFNT